MRLFTDNYFIAAYIVIGVFAFYVYKFCLYSVRFNTFMVISRGGKILRLLPEGNHWVKPWERIEKIVWKVGVQEYFSGIRPPLRMQFSSTIKVEVKGLKHEYSVWTLFHVIDALKFVTIDNSPMEVFYAMLVAEINRSMQTKSFAWTETETLMEGIRDSVNKKLKGIGIYIEQLKVLYAVEDEELQPVLKKKELERITNNLITNAEKDVHALTMLRLRHEKEVIVEQSNNEAFRRKRQEEVAAIGVDKT